MQATHFGQLYDLAHGRRLDGPWLRRVLAQRQMSSGLVIVGKVGGQDATEMAFIENDDVVETVSPYRPDKALNIGILPR
jgi:hypothetical protein